MKIATFGMLNNPDYRQEPWRENITSRLAFFDVVCLVCGNKDDINMLEKAFPVEWREGKLKAVYKPWPFPEWSYEEFPKHLNVALDLARNENCDWAVKLDIDTVFHEKDRGGVYSILQKAKTQGKWLVSFSKRQFFIPTKYWVKSSLPIAINLSTTIVYGFDQSRYTDLCQPIEWSGVDKVVYNGKNYDIPAGQSVSDQKIYKVRNIYLYNYDYTFRTRERSIELLYQIEMAHARFWGKGYSGLLINNITRETALNDFLVLSYERYKKMNKLIKIIDHPKYFWQILRDIKPEQWGYNLWRKMNFGLIFTRGISLKKWEDMGTLNREVKPYRILAEQFNKIYFFTYGDKTDLKFKDRLPKNVEIVCKPGWCSSFLYSFLLPIIWRRIFHTISIIKTNQMDGSLSAVIAKKIYGCKLVVRCGYEWLQTLEKSRRSWLKRMIAITVEKFAYNNADKIILSSKGIKDFVIKRFKIKEDLIEVIPNFVDTDLFKSISLQKDDRSIIFVGRLEPEKNLKNLFLALVDTDTKLIVIGNGSQRKELENLARENKIKVIFKGNLPQDLLVKELNSADIFVLPSLYEGNPKALLEAMACGLACVGTKVSGIEEVIDDGVDGLICEINHNSIRSAILKLLENKELRDKLGVQACKKIERDNSLSSIIGQELEIYKILNRNNA